MSTAENPTQSTYAMKSYPYEPRSFMENYNEVECIGGKICIDVMHQMAYHGTLYKWNYI